ncbi:uncharacterized protein LOC111357743 [Spodoptera litura]|uniref:Uncharacterized protein LOC111357743 n=1 Tax=Spodoptera litura TaxID=69820 RepID=A0A9J7IX81_SPOLT|nr:uncharacterized protein LOC111357743 [Spodoptera litura]
MREIPECLNRRYQMLDKLIKDLSSAGPPEEAVSPQPSTAGNDVGVKLMCDFWNILKEDPECDLPQEVHQRLCGRDSVGLYGPQQVECYLACKSKSKESLARQKQDAAMQRVKRITVPKEGKPKPSCPEVCQNDGEKLPLTQVLFNIKEAASFDKKCHVRLEELMLTQKELVEQIQNLEEKERQGTDLLKQADCMWCCMEESYKKKILESQNRNKVLMAQMKEIDASCIKWRKHKKDLEFQLTNINQCGDDIKEKLHQKNNDLKVMGMEIEEFKRRIASNTKDLDVAKNSYRSKREASDGRMATMASKMKKLQQKISLEKKAKTEKENEGSSYVKEAREDLQKICRLLLQKKLESEDLLAEKEALFQEIDLLKQTWDTCKEKCKKKEKTIADELAKIDKELTTFRVKCIKCHQCVDTADVRKYCTDCPRCLAERDCLYSTDHCSPDHSMDCVCMSVKQKFLDNVFENMYTVLERQTKTCPGKAVADCVLNCLKRSRNGKLNQETKRVLQDFILSTVKKNLNLTIVGGAVKTRCEMDSETYKQLMLCLKDVTVTRPVKEDKGTGAKKDPCNRWGGTNECNCPKGPKACVCNKAPKPPTDPSSCGLQPPDEDPESCEKTCPLREPLACSTDCGMLGMPGAPDNWRREPCAGPSCPFSKNMRAAQCVLGPDPLSSAQKAHPVPPNIPKKSLEDKPATCTCGSKVIKQCPCHKDRRSHTRKKIFEEVMGRYTEVSPIEKVSFMFIDTESSDLNYETCD